MLYQIAEKVIELEKSGKKIIKFNVGDPDQPTPLEIINYATKAMKEGKTKYGSAAGEKGLREAIAKQYETKLEKVVITPGSKWAIYAIMKVFLKRGDNIILPSPHWTAYQEIARDLRVEVKLLETSLESSWEIDLSKLESLIDEKTKMIIVNNPNNPTSKVIAENTMQEIFEIAEKKGVKILSDECYADISFKKVKSILDFSQEHFFVNSFSKTFAMTGWRLGFAIVPEKIAKEIIRLNQITFTCVPPFIQEAGIKALSLKEEISKEMKKIYKARANLACKILAKTKLKFYKPDAPFYLFPKCFTDSEKLSFDLLDEGIAITPGSAFGNYKDHFRISLTLAESQIREGLQKLREFLER